MKRLATIATLLLTMACSSADNGLPEATFLSPEGARHVSPSYSPDGSRIAYWASAEAGWQLWVANADLSEPVALPVIVATSAGGTSPALWSPDGQQLAAVASTGATAHTVVLAVAGGEPRRLTTGVGVDVPMGWFPDGERIAYLASVPGGTINTAIASLRRGHVGALVPEETRPHLGLPSPDGSHVAFLVVDGPRLTIWVADSLGAKPHQLTTEGFEALPVAGTRWSPDGRELLYESRRTGTSDVWVVTVDGDRRQLTRDVRNDFAPTWSPDGKWVAFLSDRGRQTDIWAVPAAGGEEVRITDDADIEEAPLAWRPGTNALTHVAYSQNGAVWTLDLDTGTEKQLTADSIRPTWFNVSPTGKDINYVKPLGGGIDELAVMPLGGGPARILDTGNGTVNAPRWSPDGSMIVFTSDRGGSNDVWVVAANGGPARQVIDWPGYEAVAVWSGDGAFIYFLSDRDARFGDLWKVPASGGDPTRVTTNGTLGSGTLTARPGVADIFTGNLNPAGGQLAFSRIRPDGRMNAVWDRTNAFPVAVSPTGDSVLASVEQPDGQTRHMILPASGGAGRMILDPGETAQWWSNDGRFILYTVTSDNGSIDLGLFNVADGTKRQLTTTPQDEVGAEFTPDGKMAVFTRRTVVQRLVSTDLSSILKSRP
jgi:Tol biopolymer transport system component